MTDHKNLKMFKEKVSVRDEELIREILKRCRVAVVGIHDEPYPYCVPMNYGFEWEDQLIFYFHMATDGHRIRLLKRDNRVSMAIYEFLDRHGYKRVHNEPHDYRSVMAYGRAEIICPEQEEEYLHGMNVLLAGPALAADHADYAGYEKQNADSENYCRYCYREGPVSCQQPGRGADSAQHSSGLKSE